MSTGLISYVPTRWGASSSLVVLVVAGVLKWQAGLMPENVSVPNPAPLLPNARNIYDRAELLRRDKDLEGKVYDLPGQTRGGALAPASLLPLERRIGADNQPAFALLRQGFRARYQPPAARSFAAVMPYLADDRDMARLLSIQGRALAAAGNADGAINTDLDAMQLGASTQGGAIEIGALVGNACEEIGRKHAWQEVNRLTALQARAAARRMETIVSLNVPLSETLTQEKWYQQAGLLEVFRDPNWRPASIPDNPEDSGNEEKLTLRDRLVSPRVVYDHLTRFDDGGIRRSKLDWASLKAMPLQPNAGDPFSAMFVINDVTSLALRKDANDALNGMLLVELGLRAYSVEHGGAYPDALRQLVPAYLPSVPLDPFSDRQTLRYRLASGKPLLYSVGPDGVDDGGKPYSNQDASDKGLNEDSVGDLVAGAD